jgi:hypothetical protein
MPSRCQPVPTAPHLLSMYAVIRGPSWLVPLAHRQLVAGAHGPFAATLAGICTVRRAAQSWARVSLGHTGRERRLVRTAVSEDKPIHAPL